MRSLHSEIELRTGEPRAVSQHFEVVSVSHHVTQVSTDPPSYVASALMVVRYEGFPRRSS